MFQAKTHNDFHHIGQKLNKLAINMIFLWGGFAWSFPEKAPT